MTHPGEREAVCANDVRGETCPRCGTETRRHVDDPTYRYCSRCDISFPVAAAHPTHEREAVCAKHQHPMPCDCVHCVYDACEFVAATPPTASAPPRKEAPRPQWICSVCTHWETAVERPTHCSLCGTDRSFVVFNDPAAVPTPDPAGAAGEEDKYVRAAREFDREDMRKLGEWIQANLQRHAGLSWSVAVAREVEELRARLAESERERAAVMQALGIEYDAEERTYVVLGKLAAVECDTLVEAARAAVEIPSAAWVRRATLTPPEPT